MSFKLRCLIALQLAGLLLGLTALAQLPDEGRGPQRSSGRSKGGWSGGGGRRGAIPARDSFPTWEINAGFKHDVFTFARIEFDSDGPFGWHDRWDNDYPDGDWNFSMRLQQLTSLEVDPNAVVLRLTDPRLFDCPLVYFAGVQYMTLDTEEQSAFRRYLLNGGFFMMDDLWGLESRDNVLDIMRQVLPNARPVELQLEHEIFHLVYDLKELPQVTDYLTWSRGQRFEYTHEGATGDSAPHFLAYFDDAQRMVGIVCHNNDIGDGWEREGHHIEYFQQYALKHSYPFGINVIAYAMTH